MRDLLYRKQGRRYVPVGPEFTGFPADGIWFVERESKGWRIFMRLGDLPEPAVMTVAALEQHRDALVSAISGTLRSPHSSHDIADAVIGVLAGPPKAKPPKPLLQQFKDGVKANRRGLA